MTIADHDIAALLASRICHDLISPLGAIANGVELLAMSGEAQLPEVALISESVENANARIRYFRVAYGPAWNDQMMSAAEIRSILSDLGKSSRLEIVWTPDADVARVQVRLTFLMLQCFETAMPWGGRVTIGLANEGWTLSGQADRMKIDAPLWEALASGDADLQISAAQVQFLMLPLLMRDAGRAIGFQFSDRQIEARF